MEWLGRWVGEAERARLDEVTLDLTPSRSIGLAGAVTSWQAHIAKLDADLGLPPDDHSLWVSHDLVAAVIIRDMVAELTGRAGPELRAAIEPAIADADRQYRDFTEPDEDGCLVRVDGRDLADRDWWWHRIPRRGPIRRELEQEWSHRK